MRTGGLNYVYLHMFICFVLHFFFFFIRFSSVYISPFLSVLVPFFLIVFYIPSSSPPFSCVSFYLHFFVVRVPQFENPRTKKSGSLLYFDFNSFSFLRLVPVFSRCLLFADNINNSVAIVTSHNIHILIFLAE